MLAAWAAAPERWPAEEDFDAVVDEIHAFAAEQGHDPALLLEQDSGCLGDFLAHGRLAAGRVHAARVATLYPEATPGYVGLLVEQAQGARLCQELDLLADLLERARALVEAHGGERREPITLLRLGFERAQYLMAVGLPDVAAGPLDELGQLIDERGDELDVDEQRWARSSLLLTQLNLAATLDAPDLAEERLAAARAEPWYSELDPESVREHELRLAAALADRERLDPRAEPEALALLEELHADEGLAGYERLLCETLLVECEIRAGELARARAHLEAAAQRLGSTRPGCAERLPSEREVDLLVLDALLALAEGDLARARTARSEAGAALAGLLARWRALPQHDSGLALLQAHQRVRAASAVGELVLATEGEGAAAALLALVLEVQSVGSLARALGAEPPTLGELRAALVPPGGGLVTLLPGARSSFALSVDATGVRVHRLPPVEALDRARRALLEEIGRAVRLGRPASDLDVPLAEVERCFLADGLRERIAAWSALVIAGIDGAGYVPFELLRAEGGERLGRTHAISYLPSVPVGIALAQRARAPESERAHRPLRVVAAPDAPLAPGRGELVAPLAFGAEEERRLLGGSAFARLDLVCGARATRAAVLDSGGALALHVVGHTVDTGRPDRPRGLLFFPDDAGEAVLFPGDVEDEPAPELVALMACSSAQAPLRRGDDGRHHWGGAYLLAGARTVVLAHFELSYQDALALFGELYAGLSRRGEAPAEALLAARQAADPGALGAYLVHAFGLGHERLLPVAAGAAPSLVPWFGAIAAGAALALGAWWARRKRSGAGPA